MKHYNVSLTLFTSIPILWIIIGNVEGIIGGNTAFTGQFKHQISLHASNYHICGGALISDQHILLAAHCFINNNDKFINEKYAIFGGSTNFNDKSIPVIEMKVDKIYVPKEYSVNTVDPNNMRDTGDIAVVKVKDKLNLKPDSSLSILHLPKISTVYESYSNTKPIVTGFGINSFVDDKLTDSSFKLKFAETAVIDNIKCNKIYSQRPVQHTHLCAQILQRNKKYPEGNCDGDSGNPLILNGIVIGVLGSSPLDYNEALAPAIYARVTSFLPFIHKALNDDESIDIRVATYRYKRKGFGIFEKLTHRESAS